MKVLNKIKSIYLLAIVALLSFCMLLFPAMPKTASADGIMGTGEIEIKTAKVVVQTYKGKDGNDYDKWAIMFEANITQEQYNAITDEGTANVQFGMLIGPTTFIGDATDFAGLVAKGFKPISYMGTALSGKQPLVFEGEVAEYWGAIVYDELKLDDEKGPAAMELTAIPFYADGKIDFTDETIDFTDPNNEKTGFVNYTAEDGFVGSKPAIPRNILVESYLLQKDGAAVVDGVPIKETTVDTFAGKISKDNTYDYYICRSTNRLMAGAKQKVLAATNLVEKATDLAVSGVKRTADTSKDLFDADKLANLPKYGKVNFVDYTADGIVLYEAQVAERVLMKFADAKVGTTATDTTEEYLAKLEGSTYVSIFKNTNGAGTFTQYNDKTGAVYSTDAKLNVGIWYRAPEHKGWDGLYVLGDNLIIPSAHNYVTDDGKPLYNNHTNQYSTANESSDTQKVKTVVVLPTAYLGFNGTLDGRGFYIDVAKKGAVLPVMFGATIKNIAFLNLTQDTSQGGIASHAKACTFENVYAQVTGGSNWNTDLNKGLLMNVQNCTFKNFVADANAVAKSNMTGTLTYRTSVGAGSIQSAGGGQGTVTSGVFAFRNYVDAYYSEEKQTIMVSLGNNLGQNTFINNLNVEDAYRLFPHLVHTNGSLSPSWIINDTFYSPEIDNYISYTKFNHQGTIFTGTSGENVYAVGTSPLYVGYQYENYKDASSGTTTTILKATTLATVFVNEAPKLKVEEGQEVQYADMNYKVVFGEGGTGIYTSPTTYKMSEIDDKMFEFKDDDFYSLGEIIYRGKLTRHGTVRMANLLNGEAPQDVLEVKLINMEGWYDVANYEEMATYVKQQKTPFDDAYWHVTEDGIVTWDKLLPQA